VLIVGWIKMRRWQTEFQTGMMIAIVIGSGTEVVVLPVVDAPQGDAACLASYGDAGARRYTMR